MTSTRAAIAAIRPSALHRGATVVLRARRLLLWITALAILIQTSPAVSPMIALADEWCSGC
ncbi:MAG: hypothetical protein AVDCRST_MAG77-918 [uncultured Chloroflexi bacterium]|uniref:Uncharacterized protein n=1 Tax=uncultured Chloroflexota bacterium TaxID=166587 RepID=A0A6J4HRY8_9CHLR|nr:MAG: hypothetical protein AVDCRST_MAG77-918 [uncultured Chloroflexota bacterium]